MKKIPFCYHPSTILILDDDINYLKQLEFNLQKLPFIVKVFSSSYSLLKYVNEEYVPEYWTDKFIKQRNEIDDNYQQWTIDLNIYSLPSEIYNNERFNTISCIITDYSMPSQNGLEVLEQIKHPYIKKVLLTGVVDEHVATAAFNKGLIDKFITKSDKDAQQKLYDAIQTLSQEYFIELSLVGLNIIQNYKNLTSALFQPNFFSLFCSHIKEYNIVEYYLFEDFGCYVMLDAFGKAYGLFIYPESDVKEVLSEISKTKKWTNAEWLVFFNQNPQIMCYHKMSSSEFPLGEEKQHYLVQAEVLQGFKERFYWAVIDYNLDIVVHKVLSYKKFIANNDKL